MQALDLPRRYRTIVVSSSSFQLLTEEAEARALYCDAPPPVAFRGASQSQQLAR